MHNHSSTSSGGGGGGAAAAAAADDDGPSLFVFVPNQSQKGSCSNSQKRDASFLSGPSASPFLGSRSMMSFEDGHGSNNRSFFRPFDHDENGDDEYDDFFHQPEKKRRLAIDQVQFLEKSFEFENKLEPERKVQLAKDLGLQPRQVAIWFQNRRARWKNKQLEKDYDVLQNCYNSLKADYDNLLKEKDELRVEVLMLSEKLQVKEKGGRNTELPAVNTALPQEPAQVIHNLRVADSAASHGEMCNVSIGSPKPEDLSSAKSDIFDSDSPHYADGVHSPLLELEAGDSSYVFEPEQSDLSQDEDDSLSKNVLLPPYIFPKLEEADYSDPPTTSCNFGFPIEDHAFWSWSY